MIVLGIETSCDETAVSVVADGKNIFSSQVASQIEVHHPYGGVVPELASRHHMAAIIPVLKEAVRNSGISIEKIDALAVTQGPGLVGSLLVGFAFAKSLAWAMGIPWIGVNHLEGHVNSIFLEPDPPPFPFVALLASGGHTRIYYVMSHTRMECMGQTRDDAAGEAYDKVAKMLGLGYPGGVAIDRIAHQGDPQKIKFKRTYLDKASFDFSFSGIKTAVRRYIQNHEPDYQKQIQNIAAGFQESVVDVLSYKLIQAAERKACGHVAVVGGVAANNRLREKIKAEAAPGRLTVHIPSAHLCGDNAAMIAAVGYHYLVAGKRSQLSDDVYSRAPK